MQHVQPLVRLIVLLVAASQGQSKSAKGFGSDPDPDPSPGPRLAPRYDFSRYFDSGIRGIDVGDLGSGGRRVTAAASENGDDNGGFVEPVKFKSFFGGASSFGAAKTSPFFGASAQSGSRLPFASSFGTLSAASSSEQDDDDAFGDLSKPKRGAVGSAGSASSVSSAPSDNQKENPAADDEFFRFGFASEGAEAGEGGRADFQDEDAEDRDEIDEGERPAGRLVQKAGNVRYPSYSSYYHTQPEQLRVQPASREALEGDDGFGFDDDEAGTAGAAEDVREEGRGGGGTAGSAEAYDSRPFQDARGAGTTSRAGRGAVPGVPAKLNLQGGFVPSPIDPLRTQASQPSKQASRSPSHAEVHAAVKAAHRAATAHGRKSRAGPGATSARYGAAPGTPIGLASVDNAGLGPSARSYYVRRTREEPDDAFFEHYSDDKDDDKEADDYRFGPEHFDDEDEGGAEKATDGEDDGEGGQSAAATAGNCKKVAKKGSVCMVCTDPKTGGNYEQCQYATEPETQSYSFGRSSSYGNPKPKSRRRRRREEARRAAQKQDDSQQDSSSQQQDAQDVQDAQDAKTRQRQQDAVDGFGEPLTDSHEKDHDQIHEELESSLEQLQGPKYEDYFSFLFPELAKEKQQGLGGKENEQSKKKKKQKKTKRKKVETEQDSDEVSSLLSRFEDDEDPFAAETTSAVTGGQGSPSEDLWLGPPESVGPPGQGVVVPKKDLERMLGEFQQKDRSDCTKVEKDKMTCYQCVDKKGMQHEECMFVAASEPKQSHLAYHQSSAFKQPGPPPVSPKTASTNKTPAKTASTTTVAPPRSATQRAAASNTASKTALAIATTASAPAPTAPKVKSRQQRAVEQGDEEKEDVQDADEDEDDPEGPQGLGQDPDDGMFTEETKPVYDRALRMSLPKYMLDMSEHERVFDEVLAAGA